ncbi:MAG: AAA family ATPase [Candidatus Bathyarchaeota archaeon]|nr:AAA family ATPase [Candidatus Bathyarchaeota archaeon]
MLIQEVILENFMSYEYARVPFKPGVNVIGGPNGAGKSSLLLAISVGLGQSYTERSRKLSDLIRWGKDRARVTLILDNSKRGNRRPVSKYNKDQLFLTRVLRRDGKYWFELENHAASKHDIERLLGKFGVDPDNMLIIMHQNMVEQFSVLSNIEKLRMVEAAVGLEPFRENVLQAQRKLTRILSQEESVGKLLESAKQTLNYWREQYAKYQEKKQLQTKRRFLDREFLWAEVERREGNFKVLQAEKQKEQEILNQIERKTEKAKEQLEYQRSQQEALRNDRKTIFSERLSLEREVAENVVTVSMVQQLRREALVFQPEIQKNVSQFKLFRNENLMELLENSMQNLPKINEKVKKNQTRMQSLEEASEKVINQVLENRIQLALLQFRKEIVMTDLKKIDSTLKESKASLDASMVKAQQSGARIAVLKSVTDIVDEIRTTDGHLAALADVSEDIERMYESYSKLYLELKEKAQVVAENREKTLEEVKTRLQAWRNVMQSLLERVNLEYQKIMGQTLATGEVQLANGHDIETAGLEILVGFKGGKPVALDAYTQSGGERTTATMSFLLALQQHVRSPFRAVDEYDIHMDPKNREMIAHMLLSIIKDAATQYIIITPSQITFAQEDANIITVQNVEGTSIVREVM